MYLHPVVAIFMVFWFGMLGHFALTSASITSSASHVPLEMFGFGIVLVCGGFIPEAIKAKKLLISLWCDNVLGSPFNPDPSGGLT
jgi:hypothetical protein